MQHKRPGNAKFQKLQTKYCSQCIIAYFERLSWVYPGRYTRFFRIGQWPPNRLPRGVLRSGFAGYVPLASQNPHPIIVYSVANYRPHLSHFWANVIVISRTEFNASRLLNIKTAAGTIFEPRIFLFLNSCLSEFSYPKIPENVRPHSSNSTKNVTPL